MINTWYNQEIKNVDFRVPHTRYIPLILDCVNKYIIKYNITIIQQETKKDFKPKFISQVMYENLELFKKLDNELHQHNVKQIKEKDRIIKELYDKQEQQE